MQAKDYLDIALRLAALTGTMWGFHITVMVAAAGWAISSRTWKTGLSPWVAALAGAILLAFGVANVLSVGAVYKRMNAAVVLAKEAVETANAVAPTLPAGGAAARPAAPQVSREMAETREAARTMFYATWRFHQRFYLGVDAVIAVVVAGLLSPLGRKPESGPKRPRRRGALDTVPRVLRARRSSS